jgi:SAM-dependent methyltransferase
LTGSDRPIESLALPDESVDAIICNKAVEHLPDPDAVMASFRHVLRPGGVSLIGTTYFMSPIATLLLRDRWYALVPCEHFWQFGPLTLRRLIGQNGLEIVHAHRGCTPYWGDSPRRPRTIGR